MSRPVRRLLSFSATLLLAAPPLLAAEPRLDLDGDPLPTGALVRLGTTRFRAEGRIAALAFSPDGRLLAASDAEGYVHLWERATGKLVRRIDAGARSAGLAFSPDGGRLAALNRAGRGGVWDRATGLRLARLALDRSGIVEPARLSFTPDGKHLVFCIEAEATSRGQDGVWQCFVYLVDAATGQVVRRLAGSGEGERYVEAALSPDGLLAAVSVASADRPGRRIRLIDMASGRVLHDITVPGDEPWADVLFAPDGNVVAVGGRKEIALFDAGAASRSPGWCIATCGWIGWWASVRTGERSSAPASSRTAGCTCGTLPRAGRCGGWRRAFAAWPPATERHWRPGTARASPFGTCTREGN
jgi:WD40 repeat protein